MNQVNIILSFRHCVYTELTLLPYSGALKKVGQKQHNPTYFRDEIEVGSTSRSNGM